MADLQPTLEDRIAGLETQVSVLIEQVSKQRKLLRLLQDSQNSTRAMDSEPHAIAPTEKMSDEEAIEALFGAANAAGAVEQEHLPDGLIARNEQR